jgi:hypothetical protein
MDVLKAFFVEKEKQKRIGVLEYAIQGIQDVKKTYGFLGQKLCQAKIEGLQAELKELKEG